MGRRHEEEVEDLDDVRVANRNRGPRLANETLAESRVVGQLGRDDLQGNDVVECQVRRPVDDSHPSPTGNPVDAVAGEDGAFGQLRHVAFIDPTATTARAR